VTIELLPRQRLEPAPGAVLVPDWLSVDEQRDLVEHCRRWARPPAGMRHTRLPNGGVMSVRTVCLGWHWIPYRYSRRVEDGDGAPVTPFPSWLGDLGRRAVAAAYGDGTGYEPDTALVNHYDAAARMGLHQDKDERSRAPVVSLSLGDSCIFRFGNTHDRKRPYTDIELRSGDLFVFGGANRLAYHGVPRILPGTADPAIGLTDGRLNITLRETGLEPQANSLH
jgi:alkylated DNA repair protein (DNA oxidative demethylase)